jgi:hypothetical protein
MADAEDFKNEDDDEAKNRFLNDFRYKLPQIITTE